MLKLMQEKKISPLLEEVIALEDVPSALKRLSERAVKEKIAAKLI